MNLLPAFAEKGLSILNVSCQCRAVLRLELSIDLRVLRRAQFFGVKNSASVSMFALEKTRASLLPGLRSLFHFFPQAQWAHISPDLANIFQTFSLCPRFAGILPSERQFTMGWPDRILFFMIHNRFVNCFVFAVVHCWFPLGEKFLGDLLPVHEPFHVASLWVRSCMRWAGTGCRHS